ncbi:MAG: hypothetical protein K2Q06_00360, partial [Parvularculaceae bacterium]|nr:hypothetical protein [Parvularculaceae bacterium]
MTPTSGILDLGYQDEDAERAARILNNAVGAIADFLFGDDRTKSPQEIMWSRLVLGTIALAVFVLSGFLRGYAEEVGRQQALRGKA